jgi:hypothetical protein
MATFGYSVGDGTGDTTGSSAAYIFSLGAGDEAYSVITPLTTDAIQSGAFQSGGTVAATNYPIRLSEISLRLGGYNSTAGAYGSGISVQMGITGTYYGSAKALTNTTTTYTDSGMTGYILNAGTEYGYGVRTTSGSTFTFARSANATGATYRTLPSATTHTGSISGYLAFQTIPSAPLSPTSSNVSINTLTLSWNAPSDNGGTAITGYRINYKLSSSSAWSVLVGNTGSTTRSYNVTGLTRNTSYDFQIAALNAVTNDHTSSNYASITAVVGQRSSTVTAQTLPGGPKVWNGSGWSQSEIKVWNGSTWTSGAQIKIWNGSGWSNIT